MIVADFISLIIFMMLTIIIYKIMNDSSLISVKSQMESSTYLSTVADFGNKMAA